MKIAILVAGLPPQHTGGTEIATLNLAAAASNIGHDVHVIALDKPRIWHKGFKVHSVMTVPTSYLRGVLAIPGIVIKIAHIKPDIIHAQGVQVGLSAFVASKLLKIPFWLYGRGEIYMRWLLHDTITRLLLKHAQKVIAQTADMKAKMQQYTSRNDIEVIPNGINSTFGNVTRDYARKYLNLSKDVSVVLWVGRDRVEKNLSCFAEAIKLLFKQRKFVMPMIVGANGKYLPAYSVGLVPNNHIPLYMAAADVLVNTSKSEGFPVTILEGMASGLPIVAPKVCGIPEIVVDGHNGLLTEPNNAMSTATAIAKILDNKDMAVKMSANNRHKTKYLTWENIARRLYGQAD